MTAPEHEIVDYLQSLPVQGSKRGDSMRALIEEGERR